MPWRVGRALAPISALLITSCIPEVSLDVARVIISTTPTNPLVLTTSTNFSLILSIPDDPEDPPRGEQAVLLTWEEVQVGGDFERAYSTPLERFYLRIENRDSVTTEELRLRVLLDGDEWRDNEIVMEPGLEIEMWYTARSVG